MDKFSRTTELDTAGVLNAIEEDTPKKSRRNKKNCNSNRRQIENGWKNHF
jgi:hypothetical protein